MKFQTSKGSIFNVFWWRKGQDGIPKWWILINGYRSWGVSVSQLTRTKSHGVFRFSFKEFAMEDSPWVRYDGKASAGETKNLPVSLVNWNSQFFKCWLEKGGKPIFFGFQQKTPQQKPWGNHFQHRNLFGSTTKLFNLGEPFPSTDSHLPCVSESKLPELGDGHRSSYLQYLQSPEFHQSWGICSSTPFWKSIIPLPNNPWNESACKLRGFWTGFGSHSSSFILFRSFLLA